VGGYIKTIKRVSSLCVGIATFRNPDPFPNIKKMELKTFLVCMLTTTLQL